MDESILDEDYVDIGLHWHKPYEENENYVLCFKNYFYYLIVGKKIGEKMYIDSIKEDSIIKNYINYLDE